MPGAERNTALYRWRLAASVLAFTSAFIHLALAPAHWKESAAFGLLFAGAAGALIACGVALIIVPTRRWYMFGLGTVAGSIAVYAVTRVVAPPFAQGREPLEPLGLLTKAVELGLLISLAYLVRAEGSQATAPVTPAAADPAFTRRQFFRTGLTAGLGLAGAGMILGRQRLGHAGPGPQLPGYRPSALAGLSHGHATGVAVARQHPDAMDPMTFLRHFDYGKVTRGVRGQTTREYRLVAYPKEVEVAQGVVFPAWTFNGMVPGPTLRATEGDRMRIVFHNGDKHPHTIHLHGIHPANMDGVFEQIPPNGSYTYDFIAEPFGLFVYHCHTMPVTKHIMKGLYGTFIVDPPGGRPPAREMVMVMNGFDPDFDEENEFYTVNGITNYYLEHPIKIKVGELVRIYLTNMTEFDFINSFHLHGNMFKLYRTGTRLDLYEITDTVILGQGERAILEFRYKYPGNYLFHAHVNEFAERGWTGTFEVARA